MKWLILATLALSVGAVAGELPQHVVTYTSDASESMDAFAVRIARDAVMKSGSGEVCGEFRNVDGRLVLETYTTRKLRECSYLRQPSDGYTGITFHTHPKSPPRFTPDDYSSPGYMATAKYVMHQQGPGTSRRVSSL